MSSKTHWRTPSFFKMVKTHHQPIAPYQQRVAYAEHFLGTSKGWRKNRQVLTLSSTFLPLLGHNFYWEVVFFPHIYIYTYIYIYIIYICFFSATKMFHSVNIHGFTQLERTLARSQCIMMYHDVMMYGDGSIISFDTCCLLNPYYIPVDYSLVAVGEILIGSYWLPSGYLT